MNLWPRALYTGQAHRVAHVVEVGGVETARDIGDRNERHQRFIVTHPVEAERLAHIAIDRRHGAAPGAAFPTPIGTATFAATSHPANMCRRQTPRSWRR